MTYSANPTVLTGDLWTADQHNTYIKNNFMAAFPYTEKGDIAIASASDALTYISKPANIGLLINNLGIGSFPNILSSTTSKYIAVNNDGNNITNTVDPLYVYTDYYGGSVIGITNKTDYETITQANYSITINSRSSIFIMYFILARQASDIFSYYKVYVNETNPDDLTYQHQGVSLYKRWMPCIGLVPNVEPGTINFKLKAKISGTGSVAGEIHQIFTLIMVAKE